MSQRVILISLLFAASCYCSFDQQNLDWVADEIVQRTNTLLRNNSNLPIDLTLNETNFTVKILGIADINVAVNLKQATLENVNTLVRHELITLKQDSDNYDIDFDVVIGLNNFKILFDQIEVSVPGPDYSGPLSVNCLNNEFRISASLKNKDSCQVTVNNNVTNVQQLSGCSVAFDNTGVLSQLKNVYYRILWFLATASADVTKQVNQQLTVSIIAGIAKTSAGACEIFEKPSSAS